MIKKTMTFVDYNGVERTEDFYFNLTKAEVMALEMGTVGGIVNQVNRIVSTQDAPVIFKTFQDIILSAYGEKTPDGRGFVKSQELIDKFKSTEAYSDLVMELISDDVAAANFINGILPKQPQDHKK